MSYDDDWPDNTMENRRYSIRKTIQPVLLEELKKIGEIHFPVVTDPWCIRYNEFLQNNENSKFYRARIPEGAEIIYCHEAGKAVWFLSDKGMGIVQPRGLEMLKEIVDAL